MSCQVRVSKRLIIFLILFLFFCAKIEAAELKYLRIGKHETFTRIVFEFEGQASLKERVTERERQLSVIFPDTANQLSHKEFFKAAYEIENIELIQQKSILKANIIVSMPHFHVKSFFLSKPERFVVDIYPLKELPKNKKSQEPIPVKPAQNQKKLTERVVDNSLEMQESLSKKLKISKPIFTDNITYETAEHSSQANQQQKATIPEGGKIISNNANTKQLPATEVEEYLSISKVDHLESYLLILFFISFLTPFLFWTWIKARETIFRKLLAKLIKDNETIDVIDNIIKQEFKKHEQLDYRRHDG